MDDSFLKMVGAKTSSQSSLKSTGNILDVTMPDMIDMSMDMTMEFAKVGMYLCIYQI